VIEGTVRVQKDATDITLNMQLLNGALEIGGDVLGNVVLRGQPLAPATLVSGRIHVAGAVLGQFRLSPTGTAAALSGEFNVDGGIAADGWVNIGGAVVGASFVEPAITLGGLAGELSCHNVGGFAPTAIHVKGDITGWTDMFSLARGLQVDGNVARATAGRAITIGSGVMAGQIRILGGLRPNPGYEQWPDIYIGGSVGSTGAVVCDWDGYDYGDDWLEPATVQIEGQTPLHGNTPGQKVYRVSCIVGDLNNDDVLNPFDIDPFIAALQGQEYYDWHYPGLGGSWRYHSDANCDGAVNAFDLSPFILKLTNPSAWYATYDCERCPATDNPDGDVGDATPGTVARMFLTYVDPANLPAARALIAQAIALYGDTAEGEFWSQVLALLE
jgi:hypothetical protein